MDATEKQRLIASGEWRAAVVAEARSWLFTPYQHKGRIKKVGVDCGGLLYECYQDIFGPFKAFPNDYPADWGMHKDGHEIYLAFIMPYVVEIAQPIRGGFSLFKVGRNFSHAAIFTERGTYVHAWGRTQAGAVVESRPMFFRMGAKAREAKHFDVRLACS